MKKHITLSILLVISTVCFSQKTFFSAGAELAFPNSIGLKMDAKTGFGASLRIESSISKHFSFIGTFKYLSFPKKSPYSSAPSTVAKVNMFPVQVGFKYYIDEIQKMPKGFYISLEPGLLPSKTHFTYQSNPDFNFNETGACIAPGMGCLFNNVEAGFQVQFDLTASGYNPYYYNFRLAYIFAKVKPKK